MKRKASSEAPSPAAEGDVENNDETLIRAAKRRERRKARSDLAYWWMVAFVLSNFYAVLTSSTAVHPTAFWLGSGFFLAAVGGVLRMCFWFKQGETQADFERAHPTFLLATSLAGLGSFVTLSVAFWPVYRIFTPFLLTLFWFGFVMSFHFLP
ncbi:hypothetical protein BASA81_002610 [Batrachochytrium salamandrivorans]|nr:hypothetical protein BASA81_002610 [Batrachochytrium salamandrivorans]